MRRILFTISITIALATNQMAMAQSELTLPFFNDVFQSTYLNPTAQSSFTLSIGLPGVYGQGIHNGFAPKDLLNIENGVLSITPSGVLNKLTHKNLFYTGFDVDVFHLKLRVYNWNYWLGVRQRHSASIHNPKGIFELLYYGNAHFIENPLDLSDFKANVSMFQEYTFGTSTQVNEWTFGGRLSFLSGLANAYVNPDNLRMDIDEDMYGVSINADGMLRSAGLYSALTDSTFSFNSTEIINYLTRFRNPGIALSLGATYQLDQRTTFSIAVNDLGFIHWNDEVANYRLKSNLEFNGFDILGDFLTGSELDFDALLEDLGEEVEMLLPDFENPTDRYTYNRWLYPSFYLSANHQVARYTRVGVQMHGVINNKFYPSLSVGITQGVGRVFEVALLGSYNQRTMSNVGFGFVVKPGPFQIYMVADNIFAPIVNPLTITNVNFRFGINLVFGRTKTEKYLPYH